MKKTFLSCVLIAITALTMVSCKKSSDTGAKADPLAADRAAVRALSFDASDLKKADGGYIVEGDIFLSNDQVRQGANFTNVPKEEQWRTFNLVSFQPGTVRIITIKNAANLSTAFWNSVLAAAVLRYNELSLHIRFQIVASTAPANITVSAIAGTGAQAGFPSGGNPFGSILMGTGIQNCGTNTAVSVLAHEMGHTIGFRHSDWFNRSISCGAGGSEGQQFDGVGAVLIPGTPSTADLGSFMLACYSCGGNRPFTNFDIIALRALYP